MRESSRNVPDGRWMDEQDECHAATRRFSEMLLTGGGKKFGIWRYLALSWMPQLSSPGYT